jgi:hypothetical protein
MQSAVAPRGGGDTEPDRAESRKKLRHSRSAALHRPASRLSRGKTGPFLTVRHLTVDSERGYSAPLEKAKGFQCLFFDGLH